jgi:3-oxoacyl-[acyl-carrier-protein] synthase-3
MRFEMCMSGGMDRAAWMLLEPWRGPESGHAARFESVGVKLPPRVLTSRELMASTRHHTSIDLERLTGIRERHVCSEGEDSLTLAVDAARDCLARSRHEATDIEMIVCASITRYVGGLSYRFEPPLSMAIKQAIGAPGALSFDLTNACAGMMTGVFLLNDFIRRGVIRCGMVVSGEYISGLGVNAARDIRSIFSRQLASLTLGDAGAAVIVERAPEGKPGIALAGFTTISEHSRLCLGAPAPHTPGARMLTKARTIHKVAIEDTPPLLDEVLAETGLRLSDIDWMIPHQTSARAIRAGGRELAERFGGGPKHMVVTVDEYGNTASTTHFLALRRCLDEGRIRRGEKVMLVSLASGLEIGIVLLVMDDLVEARDGHAH